jgi:uncharacterized repeat protein (TIGR01451 family)
VRGGRLTFSTIEDASSGQDQLTCRYGGGGLRVRGGVTATLDGARVEDNIAVFSGGGICAREGATLVLTGTTVVSNAVGLNGNAIASFTAGGGGLWSMGATWLTNTFVITNRAVLSGGFFGLAGGGGVGVLTGTLTVVSATVRGNVAEQNSANEANGGGLMVARWSGGPSLVRIEDTRIEDNQSLNGLVSYGGGAAFIQGVRVEMRNSIVARNVLSASEGALGGGGAFGLSYQPSGYQPPTVELDGATFESNTATVSIPSVAGQITPTVFGGGAFFGVNTTFTVTAGIVQSNTIRYTGTSITNTNGFGGGLGTLNHTSGLISGTDVLSNTAENFRFIGGAGMQTQGNHSRVINSRASGNDGVPSPADDGGGVLGGGYYVADWGAAHVERSRFEHNVITRTSANSFTSGGGVGVDGKAFITHTHIQSNTATQGGGMGIGGGGVVVARWVTVTHNTARHHNFAEGGGVTGGGNVEMRDSLIAHNVVTAPNYAAGGGVSRYGGVLRLVNVEIRQNEAQAQFTATGGGGAFGGGQAHLTQTQVLSNVARSASSGAFNGGLNNLATLRVVTSTIAHNRAVGNSSSGSGGLGNTGSAEVIDSLIANNRVALPNGNPTGSGGGIVNGDSGTLTVRRSSILANSASAAAAINTYNTPNTHILNSTISGNDSGGGLSVVLTNTAYLTHTTIASNTGGGLGYPGVNVNAYGVLIAYNSYDCTTWHGGVLTAVASLSSGGGCPSGFIANADPLLEPLALNGGATPNHALKPGSPALEGVATCGANEDQRGVSRPQGQACDIGAFELEATNLAVSKSVTPANPQTGDVLTYTIIVTNLSTFDAELVTLTDTISGNVVFGGVVSAGGGFTLASSTTNQAVFTNSVLSAGASATIVFTATATQGGLVTNTVTVRSGRPDSNLNDNTVQVPSAVQAIADLALAKAAAGGTAVAGQPFTYTLTITNNGPDTANQVVITDVLSGGATFNAVVTSTNPASLTHSFVGAQATFTVTNIAPSSVFTIVYTVLPPANGGVFSNTAVIASSAPSDPNPSNDSGGGGGPVTAAANADLAVAKSAAPTLVEPGGVVTYTLTVTNNGPSAAQFITVTDVLSGGSLGGVVDTSAGVNVTISGNSVTFTVNSLNAGGVITMVYTATAPSLGVMTNSAVVTSAVGDLGGGDNQAGVTVQVNATDLALAKAAAGGTAVAGQPFTYTLTITNNGPLAATQVVITDALSGGATFNAVVASTEPASLTHSFVGAQATFTVTGIAPSSVFTIVYTVLPPANGGVFSNTAVIASSAPSDPNPSNDSGGGGGPVTATANADLAVAKSAAPTLVEPGGVVTFTLTVTNNGPSAAQFVTVTDVLSGGSLGGVVDTSAGVNVTISGNSVTFTVNSLNAGGVITMVYTATAPSLGVMTNSAVVTSAVGDLGGGDNQAGATVQVNATDLALAKAAAGSTAVAGQPFTYTLTITNNGPLAATQVVITDALSGGAVFSAVVASTEPASLTHSFVGAQATFTVTGIAPNSVFTIVYTVLPPANGGVFSNTAVIASSAPSDPNPGDDSAGGGGPVTATANADLAVAKSAAPTLVEPGGVVTYTLTVTNNGPSAAQFITVTDVLSGGSLGGVVDTSSGVNVTISGNSVTFTVNSLNAGGVITMVYTATAPSLGVMTNSAVVTSAVGDLGGGDNQAGATVQVNATDLALAKAAAGSTAVAGQPFTYTLTITNNGPLAATQVVITDALSGGAVFSAVVASTEPASLISSSVGAQATFTVTNIAPSSVFTIVYTALPPANGGVFSNTAVIASSAPSDPSPGDDSAGGGGPVTATANADLAVAKSAAPTLVELGGVVTYTLTVTNNGPSAAQFVTVTDVLSGGSLGGVVDTSAGVNVAISGNGVTFTVNSLNAGGVITMVYTATAPSLGVMTNSAVVTSAVGDLGGGDNQAGVTVLVNATDLALAKAAAGSTAVAGQPFTYTLTITNNGPLTATQVVITDALSGGAVFSAVVASTEPASLTHSLVGAQATFTVTGIAPNSVFTIVYTVLPPANGGVFSNTAVIASSAPSDPSPGDDSAGGGGPVTATANADLAVAKSAALTVVEPGGVVTYTLTVTNNGPSAAQFVTVTDVLSGGSLGGVVTTSTGVSVNVSGNSVTFTVNSLSAGGVITMVYTATAPSLGVMTNSAVVTSAVDDLGGGDNQAGATVQVNATDLALAKAAAGGTAVAGQPFTYTLTITNNGPLTATQVVITDALSGGAVFSAVVASTEPSVADPQLRRGAGDLHGDEHRAEQRLHDRLYGAAAGERRGLLEHGGDRQQRAERPEPQQ